MSRAVPRHPEPSESEDDSNDSLSHSGNRGDEAEFHTFAARKNDSLQNRKKSTSSQESQNSMRSHHRQEEDSSSGEEKENSEAQREDEDEESIDIIEARIKKLENQLSRKLQKISPERPMADRWSPEEIKKPNLRSKYAESPNKTHKEDIKKESISPKQKKPKSKERIYTSNPHISSKNLKRSTQGNQFRQDNKPVLKSNSRKYTLPSQNTQKDPKQTIQDLKRQNEQLKGKMTSKSKKKSCLEKEIEDMDYLRGKMSSQQMTKLEKEIQLLKILESIRGKLKKSINHKLNKVYPQQQRGNKGKVTAFLLHHGCPASYLQ